MKQLCHRYDYLAIYDKASDGSPLVHKYCGFENPSNYVSTNNAIFIHFKSYNESAHQGFQLEYTSYSEFF